MTAVDWTKRCSDYHFPFLYKTKNMWIDVCRISYKPRYPGDHGEDAHGHGHDHGDVHNEEDMDNLSGPVHDFGLHDRHEDSHAG